jgi:hypothetical protein
MHREQVGGPVVPGIGMVMGFLAEAEGVIHRFARMGSAAWVVAMLVVSTSGGL